MSEESRQGLTDDHRRRGGAGDREERHSEALSRVKVLVQHPGYLEGVGRVGLDGRLLLMLYDRMS